VNVRARFEDWRARSSPRERALVAIALLLVTGAAVYGTAVPLADELARNGEALSVADARVERMTAIADDVAGLARDAKAARTAQPLAAAERVVADAGLRGLVTALDVEGNRVRLTFDAIPFASVVALVEWLGRDEQLFLVEALLAARVEPGSVRAELVLSRPQ
jgi:type II secretory pathway component PulM